jgi:hypothetical protein
MDVSICAGRAPERDEPLLLPTAPAGAAEGICTGKRAELGLTELDGLVLVRLAERSFKLDVRTADLPRSLTSPGGEAGVPWLAPPGGVTVPAGGTLLDCHAALDWTAS